MRRQTLFFIFLLVTMPLHVLTALDQADQVNAVEKIELLGGRVQRDETSFGRPIVGVDFQGSRKFADGYVHLLHALPSVTALRLDGTRITDAGLSKLQELQNLKILSLRDLDITDAGLMELKELKGLALLLISGTQVTDVGLAELKASLPDLRVFVSQDEVVKEIQRLGGEVNRGGPVNVANPVFDIRFEKSDGSVERNALTDQNLYLLTYFPRLESLTFEANRITGAGLPHLGRLKLKHLFVSDCQRITGAGLKSLRALDQLTSLIVRGCSQINDAGASEIAKIQSLTRLSLIDTQITDAGVKELSELKNLTILDLMSCPNLTPVGLKELQKLRMLKMLTLNGPELTDALLVPIGELHGLTNLHLNNGQFNDAGMKSLARLKSLETLGLAGCTQITDVGLAELEGLQELNTLFVLRTQMTDRAWTSLAKLRNLQTLWVEGGAITGVGLIELKERNLKSLHFINTGITDAGLMELGQIKSLTSIRLAYCTQFTDNGLKELKRSLPSVQVAR